MIKNKFNYVTTVEAAQLLGFSTVHIRKMIAQNKIKAEKLGKSWIILKKNLSKIKRLRFKRKKDPKKNGSYQ